ncbi:MAG: hypothetical protein NVSMB34_13160 [Variovorax sp.]
MAVSVRMDPLLERQLELAAKQKGVTKSQFIVDAVERALGKKNPYELMLKIQAEEEAAGKALTAAFEGQDQSYETDSARARIVKKLKEKHGIGRTG